MPRKTSSPFPATPTTSLALSSLHIRLETLDKEHQWLLKQIKRKRTELNNFVEQIRSVNAEMFRRCSPRVNQLADIDSEIHQLFAEIFATRKLGKQTKKDIEGIYQTLQFAGIITRKKSELENEAETEAAFTDDEPEDEFFGSNYQQHQQTAGETEFIPRNKTDTSRKIRQIFLSLAEIFHPDKAVDGEKQILYTEIMKEINRAYDEGDLARLLEIQNRYEVGKFIDTNNEDDVTRKCKRLQQENELLKNQYENLKGELASVKNTSQGSMVANCRKVKKGGLDPILEMLQQIEIEIKTVSSIRDFVKDFHQQKMTIKEFLRGPEALRRMNRDMVEDMLERMLIDLEDAEIF
ncbi:J domain-containing protein [Fortiea contorta]|uniref:J domain-containing protein n=1 Tax=Fortiea contorta TaxID=1892405 RepID=UPI00034DE9BD|nr:J domain-containing protein [Fortiea contorta]